MKGILGSVLLAIIFLGFLSISLILLVTKKSKGKKLTREHFNFQFLEYDSISNETSFGLVSIAKRVLQQENDNLSYQSENGKLVLISKLGSPEYRCLGSCYCEKHRRSTTLVGKSVAYLLTASTTFLAYQIARDHFKEECMSRISEECREGVIFSEVDKCEQFISNSESDGEESSDDNSKRKFFCTARCVPIPFVGCYEVENMADEYGCENLRRDGEIVGDKSFDVASAQIKFSEEYLDTYCKENSKDGVFFNAINVARSRIGLHELKMDYHCEGRLSKSLRNVQCREM